MASHKRVKDIDYDDDDLYSGDEDEYDNAGGDGLTEEDKENFATLTPVVRAELDEAGLQVETKEIEDALWHYFWDVGKSVTYLKNAKQPKKTATKTLPVKEKAKSKFDQAQEESAKKSGGEFAFSLFVPPRALKAGPQALEEISRRDRLSQCRSTDLCEKTVARLFTSHLLPADGSRMFPGAVCRAILSAIWSLSNPSDLCQSCLAVRANWRNWRKSVGRRQRRLGKALRSRQRRRRRRRQQVR